LFQKKLSAQLGVEPTTLAGWEKIEHHPNKRLLDGLKKIGFLEPLS